MSYKSGQLVKFTVKSRFEEWERGDLAEISRILVEFPQNQHTIYMVKKLNSRVEMWVTEAEIAPAWHQLTLF